MSVSADGKAVVSVQTGYSANIYVREDGKDEERKVTSDIGKDNGLSGVAWTPDGRIVYTARTIGNQDIWIVNSDGSNKLQLTTDAGKNFHPTVSPDGARIAFVSSRSGSIELWTMNLDGTDPIQLTRSGQTVGRPQYTPDGAWIVYDVTGADDRSFLWKVPANGGTSVQISTAESWRASIMPDGRSVIAKFKASPGDKGFKLGILSLVRDAAPVEVLDALAVSSSKLFRSAIKENSLVFVDQVIPGSGSTISTYDLKGAGSKPFIGKTDEGGIYEFDISRTGRGIAYSRGIKVSEAVLINNFR